MFSISFHVLKCFGHIFLNGWNSGSDDNVIFVLEEEPEDVDEGVDEVGDLGVGPQLGPAPPPFVAGRTSRVQKLRGKMIPGNHLQSMIRDSQYSLNNYLKSTDSTGDEQVHSIFVEGLELAKTEETIVICVEDGEPVVQSRVTHCVHLSHRRE